MIRRLLSWFVLVLLLAGCAPRMLRPTAIPTALPTATITSVPAPVASPTNPVLPATTITPIPSPQPKALLVLEKGPYLLFTADPSGMRVLWQADGLPDTLFEWGLDESYASGSLNPTGDPVTHLYQVDLRGLLPGTRYFYRISTVKEEVKGNFFSKPADAASLVFYAYGDTRSGPDTQNSIVKNILTKIAADPASQTLVISTGDLMNDPDEQSLQENEFPPQPSSLRTLQASLPKVNVMGNHDGTALFKKYFPYPFTSANDWSFDYGPAHFTIINQYVELAAGTKRWEWLQNDLASSSKSWKFILLHEPGWSAGPHDNNASVQSVIQPLAVKYGVNMILAGHNHYYARAVVNGVVHLTTGGGGAPLYDPEHSWPYVEKTIKAFHYIKLQISGKTLTVQAISPQGEILDEFSILNQDKK